MLLGLEIIQGGGRPLVCKILLWLWGTGWSVYEKGGSRLPLVKQHSNDKSICSNTAV